MRRLLPLLLALQLVACSALAPGTQPAATRQAPPQGAPAATASAPPVRATAPLEATLTLPAYPPAAPATLTPSPLPATAPAAASPTATAEGDFQLSAGSVRFHPDPVLYAGDLASVEVIAAGAPPGWDGAEVSLFLDAPGAEPAAEPLATAALGPYGLAARLQATFTWVWDTTGQAGEHRVRVRVLPQAGEGTPAPVPPDELIVPVVVRPAGERPTREAGAAWAQAETACCIFHYLTGTAAERDLALILAEANTAFDQAEATLGVQQAEKVHFSLLSRLLGHGGFASSEILVSYVDRNPTAGHPRTLFAHEAAHILDRQISSRRPAMLVEGLAVYVAGGHFKTEDLPRRAAALVALGRYIPLAELAGDFYHAQHEIGYLEAGGFVAFLINRAGWQVFRDMYASFPEAESELAMIEQGLQAHYGQGLAALEAEWLQALRAAPRDLAEMDDLRLTVTLFDTLRRYQQRLDPSAYFLTAWLPDVATARQRGIVADYLRQPAAPENVTLEVMLAAAGRAIRQGEYDQAQALLAGVNAALDAGDVRADPLAAEYLAIVRAAAGAGYEAQAVQLTALSAQVVAIREWPQLDTLMLARGSAGWQIAEVNP